MNVHTDFYVGDRPCTWAEIRAFLLSTQPACSECGDEADELDHIWPRYFGGDESSENLRAICGRCNRAKGYRVAIDAAPSSRLVCAVVACGNRAHRSAAEAEPFLDELARRTDRTQLLAAREHLAALRDWIGFRVALADDALARLEAA